MTSLANAYLDRQISDAARLVISRFSGVDKHSSSMRAVIESKGKKKFGLVELTFEENNVEVALRRQQLRQKPLYRVYSMKELKTI